MSMPDEDFWIPLVDEPIGSAVARVQEQDPELDRLVSTPRRLLAFRTFAYIRVGLLLGEWLVDHDVDPGEGATWVEKLLERPQYRVAVAREVRAVAEEVAADPSYAEEEDLGPDDDARERFRSFAQKRLEES
jgi:hypothetical protein